MNRIWINSKEKVPEERVPVWVRTDPDGENAFFVDAHKLAWYLVGKNSGFYPYEKIAIEGPRIENVDYWTPAVLPKRFSGDCGCGSGYDCPEYYNEGDGDHK
jgi:hypothetical protein